MQACSFGQTACSFPFARTLWKDGVIMAVFRATLLFQFANQPPCGFSESYEFSAPSVAAAKTIVAGMPAQRVRWLSQDWSIVGFRLAFESTSLVGEKCKKKYTPVQIGRCPGNPVGQLGAADSPYAAVLVRISFADAAYKPRNFLARGIPDTWWTAGALSIPPGDGNQFLTWFNNMTTVPVGKNAPVPTGCSSNFVPWSSYCVQRVASRKIGRPFGLLRGRR